MAAATDQNPDSGNVEPISVLDDLTDLERKLTVVARRGDELVCSGPGVEELAVTEDLSYQVRAQVIRELLLGLRGTVDPRGVRLSGARVVGVLNLDHVVAGTGLTLRHCAISEPITAEGATLPYLNLDGSLMSALHADGFRIGYELSLQRVTVRGAGEKGALRLIGARIGDQANFDNAVVSNDTGPAMIADTLHVEGILFLRRVRFSGAGEVGTLHIRNAKIGDQVNLNGAVVINLGGPAVAAETLRGESLYLEGATVNGSSEKGALGLIGAEVRGQVDLTGVTVTNDIGPAVIADGLRVGHGLFLKGATLSGASKRGSLRLLGAHIHGQALFTGVTVTNKTGAAIAADGLSSDSGLLMENATVRGVGENGALRLPSAHIGGQLNFSGAVVENEAGAAIVADSLHVDGAVHLAKAAISGAGQNGCLRLSGSQIGGQLNCVGLQVGNPDCFLIDLNKARIGAAVHLPAAVVCPAVGFCADGFCSNSHILDIDGLTFADLGGVDWKRWLHLIQCHTPSYRPQPYRQLAAVEYSAGHDNNAREILVAQQNDIFRRAPKSIGNRFAQFRHQMWGWLGRYGYRARRLLGALLAVIALAGGLGIWAGNVETRPGHHAAERVRQVATLTDVKREDDGIPCTPVELFGLGIDRGLPLGVTGLRARCDLDTSTRKGQAFTVAIWVVQAAIWALATLAIASYTGLIRKPA